MKKEKKSHFRTVTTMFLTITMIGVVSILGVKAYQKRLEAKLYPTYTENVGENAVWVGTFQLAWNEFMDQRVKGKVEFENEDSALVKELNKRSFTKDMLSENSYYIKVAPTSLSLKEQILQEIQSKFHRTSRALEQIDNWKPVNDSYILYAMLNKQFTFLEPFDKSMYSMKFKDYSVPIAYFGILNSTEEKVFKNVYVSFFDRIENRFTGSSFGVRLKTKEKEEVILYRTDDEKSFEELYQDFLAKEKAYTGLRNFKDGDELSIPYIHLNTEINYNELCGKDIKGTKGLYITNAIQNVQFELNELGGNLSSEAVLKDIYMSITEEARFFTFNDSFVLFLKEEGKEKPYFALKIDDTTFLEEKP